jgi:starch phosphorylase
VNEERATDGLTVGSFLKVRAQIVFGRVSPEEVDVQIYTGRLDSGGVLADGLTHQMRPAENMHHNGVVTFEGQIPLTTSGQHGYAVRIVPKHPDLLDPFDAGKVIWA